MHLGHHAGQHRRLAHRYTGEPYMRATVRALGAAERLVSRTADRSSSQLSARLIREPQGGRSARVACVNAHVLTTTGSLSALSAGARSARCCRSSSESRMLKSKPRCSWRIVMPQSMMHMIVEPVADRRQAGPSNCRTFEHLFAHPHIESAAFASLREAPPRYSSACDEPV